MKEQSVLTREKSLRKHLQYLSERSLTEDDAIHALEDWAALIASGHRPLGLEYEQAAALFRSATQRDLSSFGSSEDILVGRVAQEPSREVSVIRGMRVKLTDDMRLRSIIVLPDKLAERKRLLAFVGIGKDTATDVAENHDE